MSISADNENVIVLIEAKALVLQGRITSFYGPELTSYTSIRAHPPDEGPVGQFLFHDKGVVSLASRSVHLCSRRGLSQWHIASVFKPCCSTLVLTFTQRRFDDQSVLYELSGQR